MNFKFCLLAIVFVSLLVSCSKISQSKSNEVVIDDVQSKTAKGEIVIDDTAFDDEESSSTSKTGWQKATKIIKSDQSQIETSYDGFGNKTETRCFNNHLRVRCIMLRTSVEGQKQVFVYAQSGEVKKSLPADMIDKITTASADEIANSAGINQTYQRSSVIARNIQSTNSAPLRQLPGYNSPVQNPQVERIPAPETEPTVDSGNEKTKENKDTPTPDPPDKEQ
jgi:hypothetical protein